jgi:histone deacetylase complex regulatory component SIN3
LKLFSDYTGGKPLEQMQNEMRELFKDDPDLIVGFEKFLPTSKSKKAEIGGVEQESGTV